MLKFYGKNCITMDQEAKDQIKVSDIAVTRAIAMGAVPDGQSPESVLIRMLEKSAIYTSPYGDRLRRYHDFALEISEDGIEDIQRIGNA
jgi:hypothetical protein